MFSSIPLNKNQTLFSTASTSAATWTKPVDCKFVHIIMSGAGGGGGAGFVATQARQGGGGGGGGSGTHASLVLPAMFCPDTLYIYIGSGGAGGTTSGQAGSAGNSTVITLYPENILNNTLLLAGGGLAGGGGTSGGGGAAGGSATVSAAATSTRVAQYLHSARSDVATAIGLSGDPGTAGGYNRNAGVANPIDTSGGKFILGGVGGGGMGDASDTSYAGGSHTFTAQAWTQGLAGGAGGSATNGLPGREGIYLGNSVRGGFFVLGGTGGATTGGVAGAVAGAGGRGILGSGGGGGGSAYIGSTQGAGGAGGDGFVLITTF